MTVTTTTNTVIYRGNGAATTFAVPFLVLDEDHLVVKRRVFATGVHDATYVGTDYSYSGIGDPAGTLTLDGAALSSTYELTIERVVPYRQDLDIVNAGGFFPDTVETQLDLLEMQIQQAGNRADRSLRMPIGRSGVDLVGTDVFLALGSSGEVVYVSNVGGNVVFTDESFTTTPQTQQRPIRRLFQDKPNLFDWIPAAQHAGIIAGTSTYEIDADMATAHADEPRVEVSAGRYIVGGMIELGASGIGQRGFYCQAGTNFHRLDTAVTTPMFWLKVDDAVLISEGFGASKMSCAATTRFPDGLVLIGHRNMTTSHANMSRCVFDGWAVIGQADYGQTSGAPDVGVKLCNPQLTPTELASYFHQVKNIYVRAVNYGIHMQGFANCNRLDNIIGWAVGNAALPNDRALIYIEGGQENVITNTFLHSSQDSTTYKLRDFDGNVGLTQHDLYVPHLNIITSGTEQDSVSFGGTGIDAPDVGCTGTYNEIMLRDNCPLNNIGPNFFLNNNISLLGRRSHRGTQHFKDYLEALGYIATGSATAPTDRTSVKLSVDTGTLQGVLRTEHSGTDWRRQRYEAREHYFLVEGAAIAGVGVKGMGYTAAAVGAVTQLTDKTTGATLNKHVCDITLNNAALAANTTVIFTLTNSNIEVGDTVEVQHISAGTLGAYTCGAGIGAAGSVVVWVRNVTAGSLGEAIVLRATIKKASLAA